MEFCGTRKWTASGSEHVPDEAWQNAAPNSTKVTLTYTMYRNSIDPIYQGEVVGGHFLDLLLETS